MFASHDRNTELAQRVESLATSKGLFVRHNVTSAVWGHFDGWHRYVILRPGYTNYACTSKSCVKYWEARYYKYGKPSMVAEANILSDMFDYLHGV